MDDIYFRKTMSAILLVSLIILSLFILKSVIISIIISFLLVFIFSPVYDWFNKYIKSPNISAGLILLFLLLIIILPIWFLTPILIKQSLEIFKITSELDLITPLKSVFPSIFSSEQLTLEIASTLSSFISKMTNSLVNSLANIILDFPAIMLHLLIIFFTFFVVLRDKKVVVDYIKSLLPFSKEIEEKIFTYSKNVTAAVLYGQFVVGLLQGIILGIGLFIFQVPNALFFTLIAMFLGVLPIIGTAILWIPLTIYFFITNNHVAVWGILIFGLLSSNIDNVLRPIIVTKRTKIHSAIVLVSMIGGLFFFGIMGFLLGPLVISYLLILLEIYRGKAKPTSILEEPAKPSK